ncbi:hypothetical protein [Komagataeibacter sp. FNDCF1]|uniref:hypothetical protein n=1 Tax=Komagataeibacter sp. FNDCF1 TaxID=2878681 RepID=UPI001E656490|nr:hypothetical protein [Komagataeibacter sp. FNDCF1]MCE2563727.1 hypothetical protein [Komagataeibacter sp. FNDCF1]
MAHTGQMSVLASQMPGGMSASGFFQRNIAMHRALTTGRTVVLPFIMGQTQVAGHAGADTFRNIQTHRNLLVKGLSRLVWMCSRIDICGDQRMHDDLMDRAWAIISDLLLQERQG